MKKLTRLAVALALALLVGGSTVAGPAEQTTITIFATTDLHGELAPREQPWSGGEPVGGVAALSGYLNIVEAANPGGVVFVDAGDLMQGTLVSGKYRGRPVVTAMRRMGCAGVCVGNHEFDWGLPVLRRRNRKVPFLAANIETAPGIRPAWRPWRIAKRRGVRVGIIGVANPDTPNLTTPSAVAGLTFTDPAAAIKRVLPEVEAAGAAVVVVLAHFGVESGGKSPVGDLAMALDPARVHLIVGGHTHRRATEVVNGIPIVQPWPKSTGFGVVDFTLDADGRVTGSTLPVVRTTWNYEGHGVAFWRDAPVIPQARVARLVSKWGRRVERSARRVVGRTTGALTRDYRRESAMGNWVAEVVRAGPPEADFGIVNSGGLRADIDEGEVTFGEVYDVMPFDNRLIHVLVTGAALREVLELGVSGDHGVVQVSGLRFAFDYDLPQGERIVGSVIDDGTALPLDPAKTYRVAVPDFLAEGGDGFAPFAAAEQERQDDLIRDMMVTALRQHSPIEPPAPATERRMTSTGKAP